MGKAEDITRSRKTDGFLVYKDENLPKINSIRRVISAPDAKLPPILNNGQVLFSPAASANNGAPRSCYNCVFYNYSRTCQLMSPKIEIRKLIWPPEPTSDSKQIEYWPVCGYWVYGEPNYSGEKRIASVDPDEADLGWVNAPEVGLDMSGSNCSGTNDADDCDFFMTPIADKRKAPTGFCRVLQKDVQGGDCCSCWRDDDWVGWRTAQERFKINNGK